VKQRIHHIIYQTLGIILVVLAIAPARAQKPIDYFVVDQCETLEFSVVDIPGDRFTWDLYRDSTVNFAQEKGDVDPVIYFEKDMYEGATVRVNWLDPGSYFLRVMVWDEVSCTNNLLIFKIDVLEYLPEAILIGDSLCVGMPAEVKIVLTGRGPWNVQYTYGDDSNAVWLNGITESEITIPVIDPLPVGTTEFWVMEVTDDCTVNSYVADPTKVGVIIFPKPTNSKIYLKE